MSAAQELKPPSATLLSAPTRCNRRLAGAPGRSQSRQPAHRSVTIRERRLSALALCPAPTPARCRAQCPAPPRSAWLATAAEPDVAEEGEQEKDDQDDDDQGHGWI